MEYAVPALITGATTAITANQVKTPQKKVAPIADDEKSRRNKARILQQESASGGRVSTSLQSDKLG